MGDTESGLYAADFFKMFMNAGWTVGNKTFPMGVIWTGIILFETEDPAIFKVAEALRAAGIPFSIGNERRTRVTILIGGKPPVF